MKLIETILWIGIKRKIGNPILHESQGLFGNGPAEVVAGLVDSGQGEGTESLDSSSSDIEGPSDGIRAGRAPAGSRNVAEGAAVLEGEGAGEPAAHAAGGDDPVGVAVDDQGGDGAGTLQQGSQQLLVGASDVLVERQREAAIDGAWRQRSRVHVELLAPQGGVGQPLPAVEGGQVQRAVDLQRKGVVDADARQRPHGQDDIEVERRCLLVLLGFHQLDQLVDPLCCLLAALW